ncbi:hypothetical protein JCM8208_004301 [Rhodotorula glutinis]
MSSSTPVEPASKKRRITPSPPPPQGPPARALALTGTWHDHDKLVGIIRHLLDIAIDKLVSREPAAMKSFAESWVVVHHGRMYGSKELHAVPKQVRTLRDSLERLDTQQTELHVLEELSTFLSHEWLRAEAEHRRSYRASQCVELCTELVVEFGRHGLVTSGDKKDLLVKLRETVAAALPGSSPRVEG